MLRRRRGERDVGPADEQAHLAPDRAGRACKPDDPAGVRNLCLPRASKLSAHFEKDLLGGVAVVTGEAQAVARNDDGKLATTPTPFRAVPYYAWDNRGPSEMTVWMPLTR